MIRRPPPSSLQPPLDSADEVEAAFYEALQQADLQRLVSLFADDDEIVCVHPGGGRLVGLAAIRDSFEQVFSHGPVPARPEQVVRMHHGDFALHHLVEVIEPPAREAAAGEAGGGKPQRAWVLATNVYRRTPLGWRMVAHHASPSLPPAGGPPAAPSTLH